MTPMTWYGIPPIRSSRPIGLRFGKKNFADFVADHDDRRAELVFLRRDRAARGEVVLLDREVVAVDRVRVDLPRPRVRRRRHRVVLALDRPSACRRRQHRPHERHVGREDARAPLPLEPLRARDVVAEPRIAPEREGVGAEETAGEVVLHVSAHPLDDRDDGDQEHHADHDAEQREEALELLDADLGEREAHGFEDGTDRKSAGTRRCVDHLARLRPHSYRSASTGSSFAARIAGSIPNSTPVIALAPSAATIASGGTDALIGVALRMITDDDAAEDQADDRADRR